ncbi:8884_t:CDS:2 [Acaulospora morrowiae]|uniref:8884_t:CDS:1 n=1 Tax=Acaulospora morrowiae TaxID=94023 RepID=A0A9N9AVS7_9GLOM|nr:8884_t:CDS:2 [Acaulospora morrowiae]
MSTRVISFNDLRQEFRLSVIRLQADAKSEFERKAEKIQEEVSEMNEDEIEDYVRGKFQKLNSLFLERSIDLEEYVIGKKPQKPVKNPDETNEEYQERNKAYEDDLKSYKTFTTWSMNIIERLTDWLSELFDEIMNFFKNLWILIKCKFQDIYTSVRNFVERIAEKFSQLHKYLFR